MLFEIWDELEERQSYHVGAATRALYEGEQLASERARDRRSVDLDEGRVRRL